MFKKAQLLGIIATSVLGVQVFSSVVSANSLNTPQTSNQVSSQYQNDPIYNNLSDFGKTEYIQQINSSNEPTMSTFGFKKSVLTAALRYGGPALGRVLDYLNADAAHYVIKHSKLIADTLDSVSSGFRGAVVQALIKAGVPQSAASTIGWAIETVLL